MGFMANFREINCALSCRTFFGNCLSQDAVKKIADDFYLITAALELVNIPLSIYVPYTKPWRGKRISNAVLAEFPECAAASKAHMATGAEPTCIVDEWVLHMMESKKYHERIAAGEQGSRNRRISSASSQTKRSGRQPCLPSSLPPRMRPAAPLPGSSQVACSETGCSGPRSRGESCHPRRRQIPAFRARHVRIAHLHQRGGEGAASLSSPGHLRPLSCH